MILLYALSLLASFTAGHVEERSAVVKNYREAWKNGIVYYDLNNEKDKATNWKPYLKTIFQLWENFTCIQFQQLKGPYDKNAITYISIELQGNQSTNFDCEIDTPSRAAGTHSTLRLPTMCKTKSLMTIIGKSLGLRPEHRRPDRNHYIDLKGNAANKNTKPGKKYTVSVEAKVYGMPYDYESVLHGSWNDSAGYNAISVKKAYLNNKIGSEMLPSFYDYKSISFLYNCNATCRPLLKCFNGGYVSAPYCDVCRCYPGYKGRQCEKIETRKKYNKNQHKWSSKLVGKVSDCRAKIFKRYVIEGINRKIESLVRVTDRNLMRTLQEAAGDRMEKMLAGNARHMPYKALGGYSAPLFVSLFKNDMTKRFKSEDAAARVLGGSSIVEMLKNDLGGTLGRGLSSGSKEQVAESIGVTLADVIGAEMHGPIGKEIAVSNADTTRGLINECIDKVFYDLSTLWKEVKQYYDNEFA